MNPHPADKPLPNGRVCHHVRAKLLGHEPLPLLFGCGTFFYCGLQSATLNTAVFDPILHYGRTIAGVDAKPVACQHKASPACSHPSDCAIKISKRAVRWGGPNRLFSVYFAVGKINLQRPLFRCLSKIAQFSRAFAAPTAAVIAGSASYPIPEPQRIPIRSTTEQSRWAAKSAGWDGLTFDTKGEIIICVEWIAVLPANSTLFSPPSGLIYLFYRSFILGSCLLRIWNS